MFCTDEICYNEAIEKQTREQAMNLLDVLNREQCEAVTTTEGPLLILQCIPMI